MICSHNNLIFETLGDNLMNLDHNKTPFFHFDNKRFYGIVYLLLSENFKHLVLTFVIVI